MSTDGPPPRRASWAAHAVRWALRSWPDRARRRDGAALLQAVLDGWADAPRPPRSAAVLLECLSIVVTGVGLRARAATRSAAGTAHGLAGDVRRAIRSLRRAPGFTATVTVSFALGIGANAAVFGVVDRVLATPPAYEDPGDLTFVWRTLTSSPGRFRIAAPDAAELGRRSPSFEALGFVSRPTDGGIEAADGSAVEHVRIAQVSPDLLDVLGVRPQLGGGVGTVGPEPTTAEGAATTGPIWLSREAWVRLFAEDAAVVGRNVRLNGRSTRVAGVLPRGFGIAFPPDLGMGGTIDVWAALPIPLDELRRGDGRAVDQDSDNTGAVIARLREGVTLEQAAADAAAVAASLRSEEPTYETAGVGFDLRAMQSDATAWIRPLLRALLLGAAALLLVTCLNVSTLSLARGFRRRREVAIRSSLGAGRAEVVRGLVAEASTLVTLGGVSAILVADLASTALSARLPAQAWSEGARVDPGMLLLSIAAAAVCTLAFTVAPASDLLRHGPSAALQELRGATRSGRARDVLVALQVAVSVVLVLTTGLLSHAARDAYTARPGFEPEGALTFALSVRTPGRYSGPGDRARLMRDIESALVDLPGVTAVGVTGHLPLSGRLWTQPFGLPGQPPDTWGENRADFRTVSSGYFEALGVQLLAGRSFTREEDLREDRRVVVIDEVLAGRLASGGGAIGRTLGFPLDGSIVYAEVVGVVAHVRHERLDRDGRETLYVPYRQEASRDVSFVVRATGDALALAPAVRQAVRGVDPQLPVHALRTLSSYVDETVAPTRFAIGVVGSFAALVLLSVAVGLHGVVALELGRRTREIGVRIALGASRRSVVATLVARATTLTVLGALVGVACSAVLSRVLTAAAPGVSLADPFAWTAVAGALAAVSIAAWWLPARRVTGLDPTEALRSE